MTSKIYRDHRLFEDALYQAFPLQPLPSEKDLLTLPLSVDAKAEAQFYVGKSWPEVAGLRFPGLTDSPSLWAQAHSLPVVSYYLPGHLIFASWVLFLGGGLPDYPGCMTELFFLAPTQDPQKLESITDTMGYVSDLARSDEVKRRLFGSLNHAQRQCVAQFLNLYIEHRENEFVGAARDMFKDNVKIWEESPVA